MVYKVPEIMTDVMHMSPCTTFDDLLHQLNGISEQTLDEMTPNNKLQLQCHRMKDGGGDHFWLLHISQLTNLALFAVLCEVKDKTCTLHTFCLKYLPCLYFSFIHSTRTGGTVGLPPAHASGQYAGRYLYYFADMSKIHLLSFLLFR